MYSVEALKLYQPGAFTSTYRLRDAAYCESRHGHPYLKFMLEDSTGSLPAYIWDEHLYRELYLPNYVMIQVTAATRVFDGQLRVNVSNMVPTTEKASGEVLRLIPQSLCPIPRMLSDLEYVLRQITIPALQNFVEAVLADDGIAFAFISVPASLRHHHNYPGGLLYHSLDSVQMLERHRDYSRNSYELGIVAMLFHDIGKIMTLTSMMTRTSLGSCMDHDKLTLEVLSPYLRRMEQQWTQGAQELRYLLTWKINKPVPRYDMADLVACCDRLSAGLDMQRAKKKPYLSTSPAHHTTDTNNVTVALSPKRYRNKREMV
jgi:3'-5' exoribonuclease